MKILILRGAVDIRDLTWCALEQLASRGDMLKPSGLDNLDRPSGPRIASSTQYTERLRKTNREGGQG